MNEERLLTIILAPLITEKTTRVGDYKNRQVGFKVLLDASKHEIKAAIEKLFKVEVDAVTTLRVKGKTKQFKNRAGRRSDWKKAYVKLKEGFDIDFASFEG